MAHIITQINDLKRIEKLATEELAFVSKGKWYDGRDQDVEKLQKIARDARIKRLELELVRSG